MVSRSFPLSFSAQGLPRRRWVVIALAFGLNLWIGTPVRVPAQEAQDGTKTEALRSRITAYWEARVAKRYEEEYGFLDPLVREQLPLPAFIEARQYFHVRAFRILGVETEGSVAQVRISFTFEVILPNRVEADVPPIKALGPKQEELVEEWVEREGTWYKTLTRPPVMGGGFWPLGSPIFS